jgi:hypothetical protein
MNLFVVIFFFLELDIMFSFLLPRKLFNIRGGEAKGGWMKAFATSASTCNSYSPPPSDFQLEKVIVVHRHGDRTPLVKSLGPNFPERSEMRAKWSSTLPSSVSHKRISSLGEVHFHAVNDVSTPVKTTSDLYVGWDNHDIPTGQLTEIGVQQLISFGKTLRERYGGDHFIPTSSFLEADNHFYCRSTYLCRTIHSIRALLVGFYDLQHQEEAMAIHASSGSLNSASSTSVKSIDNRFPKIYTRPRSEETMFPQVDGKCDRILRRRSTIEPLTSHTHLPFYQSLTEKMKRIFGFTEEFVPWLTLQEVFTCHSVYEMLDHFPEIGLEDLDQVNGIIGTIWGILYGVRFFKSSCCFLVLMFLLLHLTLG